MRASWILRRKAVAGVASSDFFATLRSQIIDDLNGNRNDRSLAGRVDPEIRTLVQFFNEGFQQYVTSSSCSGRVSLFHKAKSSKSHVDDANHQRKRGGFGKGTIFQSHDPLPDVVATVHDSLQPCLGEWWSWRAAQVVDTTVLESEVLQFKYEPMILHLLCADLPSAAVLLQCASESGQMNSGIVSCSRGTAEHPKITCCITSPLTIDIPLFSHGKWLLPVDDVQTAAVDAFRTPAWTALLTHAVTHANRLFTENVRRKERFADEVRRRLLDQTAQP